MVYKVAIIGGGPAGLTAASVLRQYPWVHPVVLEKEDRIGGKSWTLHQGPLVTELGTCYSTKAHRYTDKLMQELGFEQYRLGRQMFDGRDFVDYLKTGPGRPLAFQTVSFILHRRALMRRAESPHADEKTFAEAAQPIEDWLEQKNLPKMKLFMHRALTALGYGYVETTPTIQALRWCDWDLLQTGLRNHLYLPKRGWTSFWQELAKTFEIRTGVEIRHIDRSDAGVEIQSNEGTEAFDAVVNAVAPDTFAGLVDATETEAWVSDAIDWQGYVSCIIAAEGWFSDWATEGYSESATADDKFGRLVAVRADGEDPELGGKIYFTGQIPGPFTDLELRDLLRFEIERRGGSNINIIHQKRWKYFPRYKQADVARGLVSAMKRMQGEKRTWHTGAAFSHEAVSNITKHNLAVMPVLAEEIRKFAEIPTD